ncbi:MAG: YesL family protein, partial [Clostridia bacterium]|nr:YesL family protein [Clostridia bacterium]
MGIFGGNFTKPGKGISKEEAAKRNYFDILGRHFWDLVKLNLLYFGCNILFFGAAIILSIPYFYEMEAVVEALIKNPYVMLPPLPFIPFIFIGPFTAGFTYVLRNWSRQEHAFLVSDFFEFTKKNWKQGLALSAISTVVTYLFCTAFLFYFKSGINIDLVLVLAGLL